MSKRTNKFLRRFHLDVTQDEQILAIRYVFLVLPDENREVLENLLRFLLDVSIRSGNSQVRRQDERLFFFIDKTFSCRFVFRRFVEV